MQDCDNNFDTLIGHMRSMLDSSFEELKRKYIRYSIRLIVSVENRKLEKIIEIRFNTQEATLSLDFGKTNQYKAAYLFFDTQNNENNLIEYLTESYDFDFRKNRWLLDDCYLKIINMKDIFCFYLFR